MLYIGVDLGTSAVKLELVDENGVIKNEISKSYPVNYPHPGWSEQDPDEWKKAVLEGIPELIRGFDRDQVKAIGAGGQMHGLVVLDKDDRVIRPAILWNDGRTQKQVDYLNEEIGRQNLSAWTANIAFAGFTAPKILWMRENEKENFDRIRRIMLPKDYINYVLTGVHCTDFSDASGMLLLDVKNRRWSPEMVRLCGITEEQLPRLFESYEKVGTLKKDIAEAVGLNEDVVVAAGAGDNAAAAVGTGVVGEGGCNISLGTSGTVFISSERFGVDPNNALHSFDHADGGYHLMACMLSAASCLKWLEEDILKTTDYTGEQAAIREENLGRNSVYFLPYMMGERSPINDVRARGTFIGMTLGTTRADLTQAGLEGVAFAIRDSLEVARSLGITLNSSMICGGGAKSPLWQRIMANVNRLELKKAATEQGPGFGGAILAMVAFGAYPTVKDACEKLITVASSVKPEEELMARYEERYRQFRNIYPTCKALFPKLQ